MLAIAATPTTSILLWAGILIVVAIAGGIVIFAVRRRMLTERSGSGDTGLIENMRRMVERGEMTQDEFDKARRAIVEQAKGPKTPPGPSDPSGTA